ncbi:type VI secretion system tube protein Hcp [Shewanella rhizosphaerae]|uniref:Hcp family type VI secretion system effector n=1 Tax=Shewanella rhizosphaerae TaxID=2864207 RepID=UPI001C65871C|nr:type VI secretion system tube protein Hcp [Shewanella rhizosphaerae]QYK13142.1 type VI secretion system tube protein Hcp [Shewanella rhizosphaerae]
MYKLAAMGLLALSSLSLNAATDMFLKIDGVDGESLDAQHRNEIDVLAWSWGASSDMRRTCIQDISVTKYVDSASPQLLMNQMSHMQYPRATLTVRKAGGTPLEYIVIELRDVWVSSLSTGGSGGEDRLTENITLNFDELKYLYTPQKADGSGGPAISATITSEKCR